MRQLRPAVQDTIERHSDDSHARRIVGISKRREAPHFLICDAFMNVLSASREIDVALTSPETLASLAPYCRKTTNSAPVFHVYNDEIVLRIVPLSGMLSSGVIIFVDEFNHRGPIFEAAKTFRLTKRESETLQLLLRGKTNLEIADSLVVAESTVGDHVKSVMRKMNVSKRGELISKIFDLEHEINGARDREDDDDER
jgi:DNA-binding CsgD family transcriptional regulator